MATIPDIAVTLASTSRYRADSLSRILSHFDTANPAVDETALPGENPRATSRRLSQLKAAAVAASTGRIVIGSDQVAAAGAERLVKPGNADNALTMLEALAGREVLFYTSVTVAGGFAAEARTHTDETAVTFARLARASIERYIRHDRPFDCAGGFRIERAGPVLFESVRCEDPTALIGLPLIVTARELALRGLALPR